MNAITFPIQRLLPLAAATLLAALLAACASAGHQEPPALPLSNAELGLPATSGAPNAVTSAVTSAVTNATTQTTVPADWWKALGDPALDTLVTRALAAQPSLKVAAARLARAQAGVAASDASAGPQVGAGGDLTRQRYTENGLVPPPIAGSYRTLGNLQLDGSWELDFFGRHRAEQAAATGQARAAQAELDAARSLLASSVVRTWVQLGRLFDQRDLAQRGLQQRDEILALTRQRVQAGLDSQVDLRQAEGALPDARQQIEQLKEQIALTRHALAALSAQPPQALADATPQRGNRVMKAWPTGLPSEIPADLLARRADVAAAKARVEAASSDVQAARALFYPNINLRAFAGLSAIGLDKLLRPGSAQFGVGPAVHLPLFDAGRLRANLGVHAADLDAAVESYNATVLDAVRDVADQLGSLDAITRQQAEQAQAQAAAEAAYALAQQRQRAGVGSLLVVLNLESAVLAQRRAATDLRARALDTQIALIKALGGGYAATAA
jgi:NodT family efflux transporter outer membrane factor (OMF) lipoprotein